MTRIFRLSNCRRLFPILALVGLMLVALSAWRVASVKADFTQGIDITSGASTCLTAVNNEIVFVRGGDIYVMNPDGTGLTQLTVGADARALSVSNDGTKIAYTSSRNAETGTSYSDIYIINADGSNDTRLTSLSGNNQSPSFSPDGTKLVFVSDRDNPGIRRDLHNESGRQRRGTCQPR